MRRTLCLCLLALTCHLGSLVSPARAGTIFSNLGPGDSYDSTAGWSVSTPSSSAGYASVSAMPFTPTTTASLASIELAIQLASGTNSLTIELLTDNNNSPGSVIESYSANNQMVTFGTVSAGDLVTVTSLTQPTLMAGTQYWVGALPGGSDTFAIWAFSLSDDREVAQSADGGTTWNVYPTDMATTGETVGAFQVNSVPEPGALVQFSIAVAGVAGYCWRCRKRAN
jgi:hypothetical protein